MAISIELLTAALWPAFEDLFGRQGACYGCRCTHFHNPPAVRRENDRQRDKDQIRARVEAGFRRMAERKPGRPLMRLEL